MKRFTLTLSLLLVFVTVAMAQKYLVRESVTDVQSGYYVVMATSNVGNVATASTGPVQYNTYTDDPSAKYRMDADKTINVGDILADGNYVWQIENNGTTITLRNVQDNVYFVQDAGINQNFSGTETANLILEKISSDDSDKRFYLTLEDEAIGYIHCNSRTQDPCLSYWNSKAETGSCVRFEFYPVEEYIDLYEPYSTGLRSTGASKSEYANRQITSVTVNGTTVNNTAPTQLYVDLTASSFTVTAGADVQVTVTTSDEFSWMHSYVYVDFDSDGFQYVEGDAVPLGDLVSYSFKHTDADGTDVNYGHNSNNETVYGAEVINQIPSFKAPTTPGAYRMRYKMAWDDFDPNGNAAWVSDAGTIIDFTLVVEPAQAEAATLRTWLDIIKVYYDAGLIGEHTCQYSSSVFDDPVTIYESGETFYWNITSETEVSAINSKITNIETLVNSLVLNMPKSGAVYTFETVNRGWWASGTSAYLYSTEKSGASVTTANASASNEACQWVVYQGSKGQYIYNVAAGKFVTLGDDVNSIPLADYPNNSTLTFKESTSDGYPYLVGLDNKAINLNKESSNFVYGAFFWVDGWNDEQWSADPGSAVRITYVKDADVETLAQVAKAVSAFEDAPYTLNVGATGYASLYLGFDATIPDGVEAYIATATGIGYVHMDRITGTLPAKTAVVIKATANTSYEFVVSAGAETVVEGGATVEDNLLLGTTTSTYIYEDAYVLSAPDGAVAFHLAEMNQENGTAFINYKNRVYMPKSVASAAAQGSASFRFVFGTTGIEEITEQRAENKEIYDLQGRKLNEITAPGMYIVNGCKVFVK